MPISPQGGGLYNFTVATDVSGGKWDTPTVPNMEGHLQDMILKAFPYANPGGANPLVNLGTNDGGITIFTQFTQDISSADQAILSGLVFRAADYYIVTTDGGVTDIGDNGEVSVPAGPNSSTIITLQYKNGDGSNSNGYGDGVTLNPGAIMPISALSGNFDGNGKFAFTIGASQQRGNISLEIDAGMLPVRHVNVLWT